MMSLLRLMAEPLDTHTPHMPLPLIATLEMLLHTAINTELRRDGYNSRWRRQRLKILHVTAMKSRESGALKLAHCHTGHY